MEQALYITKTENFRYWMDDFRRLYFGIEFCERLLPSGQQLTKAIDFAREKEGNFTLVTPYVTSEGMKKAEKLITLLSETEPGSEIVFNDWGIFHLLQEKKYPLQPILGRLLNKMKRGPRILPIREKIPSSSLNYFMTPGVSIPSVRSFLISKGIERIEFDNLLQGLNLEGIPNELHLSLYLPYAYITTTRFCFMASADQQENFKIGVLPCRKQCKDYAFSLFNPVMSTPLIRKGNTIFFSNDQLPVKYLRDHYIDRIVIQPEIPL